jgi:hypothetical protein
MQDLQDRPRKRAGYPREPLPDVPQCRDGRVQGSEEGGQPGICQATEDTAKGGGDTARTGTSSDSRWAI